MPALRQINQDIKEITQNPIKGNGITSLEGNIMQHVINMRLMTGPYEGYCAQLPPTPLRFISNKAP